MSIENYNKESKGLTSALNYLSCRIIPLKHIKTEMKHHSEMDRIIKGCYCITSLKDIIIQPKTARECLAGPQGPDRQSYMTQTLSEYTHMLDKHFKILP